MQIQLSFKSYFFQAARNRYLNMLRKVSLYKGSIPMSANNKNIFLASGEEGIFN